MAGHGGGGGGHGGGGGKKKGGGVFSAISGNGCLRYLALFVVALLLLISGTIASALGVLHLPNLPGSRTSALTVNTKSVPAAAPTTKPSGSTTGAGAAAGSGSAAGTTASSGSGSGAAAISTGGGNASTAPLTINALPLPGAQGAAITPLMTAAFYLVEPGDTLDTVAARYSTTRDALSGYNRLTDPMLRIGQVIYLPPAVTNQVPNTGRNAGDGSDAPANPSTPNDTP